MRIVAHNEWDAIRAGAIPGHVGFIMDGNGRWAQGRGLPRTDGHRAAARATASVIRTCAAIDVRWVTLFAFSTENWNRPAEELACLTRFHEWLWPSDVLVELRRARAAVHILRTPHDARVPDEAFEAIGEFQSQRTADVSRFNVAFAVNYGSRRELADACGSSSDERRAPTTEGCLGRALYCPSAPDLDLVVRTGGDQRLSNFMLWQLAYAELVFAETLWPDLSAAHVYSAVAQYQQQQRRFGHV